MNGSTGPYEWVSIHWAATALLWKSIQEDHTKRWQET